MPEKTIVKKSNKKPDTKNILQKIGKYHFPVFIFAMALGVGFMLYNVYQILNAPSDSEYLASKQSDAASGLDLESVRAVERLEYSDEATIDKTIISDF